ncbi:hypothetical protein [Rhodopseudomonas sp. P2A-2r]|uniref:hypothetical protein n=1 Tax=unclassified Rhodopseudomonas TaxID=2638247 RepID=UPI002234562F|nr:hypothetical protein [Rhodopseudomonas sp. P2A-2r]UZE47485.1 hypothetical protein ONR75_21460 [Rhodopseudomonas sp. P2A-2r]
MIAKLKTTQTTQQADPLTTATVVIAPFTDKKPFDVRPPGNRPAPVRPAESEISRRRLRNLFILANAIVWIVIIVAVRLIFF